MKARRAIAAAAAVAIAATTGVFSADAASAATPRLFCVNNMPVCALPQGGNAVAMLIAGGNPNSALWLFNGINHDGQIQENGTSLCMQLDANGGYIVIEAPCNKASYQEWDPYLLNGSIVYGSEWDESQCLTYNRDLNRLDTVTCTGAWYQNFPGTP
jgi:hypothetical protein